MMFPLPSPQLVLDIASLKAFPEQIGELSRPPTTTTTAATTTTTTVAAAAATRTTTKTTTMFPPPLPENVRDIASLRASPEHIGEFIRPPTTTTTTTTTTSSGGQGGPNDSDILDVRSSDLHPRSSHVDDDDNDDDDRDRHHDDDDEDNNDDDDHRDHHHDHDEDHHDHHDDDRRRPEASGGRGPRTARKDRPSVLEPRPSIAKGREETTATTTTTTARRQRRRPPRRRRRQTTATDDDEEDQQGGGRGGERLGGHEQDDEEDVKDREEDVGEDRTGPGGRGAGGYSGAGLGEGGSSSSSTPRRVLGAAGRTDFPEQGGEELEVGRVTVGGEVPTEVRSGRGRRRGRDDDEDDDDDDDDDDDVDDDDDMVTMMKATMTMMTMMVMTIMTMTVLRGGGSPRPRESDPAFGARASAVPIRKRLGGLRWPTTGSGRLHALFGPRGPFWGPGAVGNRSGATQCVGWTQGGVRGPILSGFALARPRLTDTGTVKHPSRAKIWPQGARARQKSIQDDTGPRGGTRLTQEGEDRGGIGRG